jgi:hypothetical protein
MNEADNVDRLLIWTTLRPLQTDCGNLRGALAKLAEDDPTFSVDDEDVDSEVIIRATGRNYFRLARHPPTMGGERQWISNFRDCRCGSRRSNGTDPLRDFRSLPEA